MIKLYQKSPNGLDKISLDFFADNKMGFFFNQNSKISDNTETTTTTLPPAPTEPSPNPSCSEIASTQSSENPGCPAAHCDDTGLKVIFYADWMNCRALECNWNANYGWFCME